MTLVVAGCSSGDVAPLAPPSSTQARTAVSARARPTGTRAKPTPTRAKPASARAKPTPAGNKRLSRAEAKRLLKLVVAPPGSVKQAGAPRNLRSGPVTGTPGSTSLIDDHAYWKVPMTMRGTLAWFAKHAPGGLAQTGSGSSSSRGVVTSRGYEYDAPSRAAWTGAEVDVSVVPDGSASSVLRADGIALWIDPIPMRDNASGPRIRLTLASSCRASDRGAVGVTNPSRRLEHSLLPSRMPTRGLVCEYYGLNGHPFALKKKLLVDRAAADALAARVQKLSLGHIEEGFMSCPMDDGTADVAALVYPGGRTVDLWMPANGCRTVSNGYIRAWGSVRL